MPVTSSARGMSNNAAAGTDSSEGTRRGQQDKRHTSTQRRAGYRHAGVQAWARRPGAAAACLHAYSRRCHARGVPGPARRGVRWQEITRRYWTHPGPWRHLNAQVMRGHSTIHRPAFNRRRLISIWRTSRNNKGSNAWHKNSTPTRNPTGRPPPPGTSPGGFGWSTPLRHRRPAVPQGAIGCFETPGRVPACPRSLPPPRRGPRLSAARCRPPPPVFPTPAAQNLPAGRPGAPPRRRTPHPPNAPPSPALFMRPVSASLRTPHPRSASGTPSGIPGNAPYPPSLALARPPRARASATPAAKCCFQLGALHASGPKLVRKS